MPASNRVVCLLSGPLAAVGRASRSQPSVEGELRSIPCLDAEGERSTLESALREGCADTGRAIELQIRYATVDALRSAVTLGSRVVHFSGHGHPEFLCFEDLRGLAVGCSPTQLTRIVAAGGLGLLRLVVVNSCHSQKAGEAFVEAGVPHVVAVSCRSNNHDGRVSDRAATAFCRAFYLGVIAGRSVRQAFDIGCAAAGDQEYVLLPENEPHDEKVFADAPQGSLEVWSPRRTPTNAPASPTSYLGRDAELFTLIDAILRHRLTTVCGAFGSGKSALAAAAAHYIADRGTHFEAVVWVRVNSRDRLVDDVVDAVRRVLTSCSEAKDCEEECSRQCQYEQYQQFYRQDVSGTCVVGRRLRRRSSEEGEVLERVASFSSLVGGALIDEDDDDTTVAEKTSAAAFLTQRRVLIVLDDFERLLVTAPRKDAHATRLECQNALASLVATASKASVVLTCSRGSGLGRATSVTERVLKLRPLGPVTAATLLLRRSPELARRATNVKAARHPRTPPDDLVNAVARHAALARLGGNPFAIALGATLLNNFFEADDARVLKTSASDTVISLGVPPPKQCRSKSLESPVKPHPLEPLDKLVELLDASDIENPELARLRDEITFVATSQTNFASQDVGTDEAHTSDEDSACEARAVVVTPGGGGPRRRLSRSVSRSVLVPSEQVVPANSSSTIEEKAPPQKDATVDPRVFNVLGGGLVFVWLARVVFDALASPDRAFNLRLDAVVHLFLDLALLVVLASLQPVIA